MPGTRRWWVGVAAFSLALGLGLAGCTPGSSGPEAGTESAPAPASEIELDPAAALAEGPSSTSIDWADCGEGFECAEILVPLDYDEPDGDQVRLALKRLPGQNPRGSLVFNPGGPGASALDWMDSARELWGPNITLAYDIVTFDPRGIGESSQVVCPPLEDDETDPWHRVLELDDQVEVRELETWARTTIAECEATSGPLAGAVGSAVTARDLDRIRELLGEEHLNFYGFSYGAVIGVSYLEQFPDRVERFVLDSPVTTHRDVLERVTDQGGSLSHALDRFLEQCVAAGSCALGEDPAQARAEIEAWIDDLDPVARSEVVKRLGYTLYVPWTWGDLAPAVASAMTGDDDALSPWDTFQPPGAVAPHTAILCGDEPAGRTFEEEITRGRNALDDVAGAGPFAGISVDFGAVCALWPRSTGDIGAIGAGGPGRELREHSGQVLVVGIVHDPAVPYAWAVEVAESIPGAMLLAYDADGHGAFGGLSACVDMAVTAFLLRGDLPSEGATC